MEEWKADLEAPLFNTQNRAVSRKVVEREMQMLRNAASILHG